MSSSFPKQESSPLQPTSHRQPQTPWLTFLYINIRIRFLQYALRFALWILPIIGVHKVYPPDLVKSYPRHPNLKHRIFIPKSSLKNNRRSDETPKYPLVIDIHGGGFALLNPGVDDKFNRPLCDDNGFVVVSLDYYKSPQSAFPIALNALAEVVLEVLNDDSLPIDKDRVVLHGASAGAALALGLAQYEELQGKIKGLVLWYPPVDATFDRNVNFQRYVDNPKKFEKAGKVLPLKAIEQLTALYLRPGTNLRDPKVSPRFCDKGILPRAVLTVGCEFDGLCEEAGIWMRELAGVKEEEDMSNVWERNGKKWIMVEGEDHGFDHDLGKTDKVIRTKKAEVVRKQVVEWLKKEVFN